MPALLTSWSANREKEKDELLWELLVCPVLYGPVCLLDNMICDNIGLYKLLVEEKESIYFRTLKKYARLGLISLWHREFYIDQKPIKSTEDILLNWLCRAEQTALYQVGFGILESKKDANDILRGLISNWNVANKPDKYRIKEFYSFIEGYYPEYQKFISRLNEIFFKQKAALIFLNKPAPLQHRLLNSFGIDSPGDFLSKRKKKKHAGNFLIKHKKIIGAAAGFDREKLLALATFSNEDDGMKYFFDQLIYDDDAPVTSLLDTLKKVKHKDVAKLKNHILNVYDTAIPEANNEMVLIEKRLKRNTINGNFSKNMYDIATAISKIRDFSSFIRPDYLNPPLYVKDNLEQLKNILFPDREALEKDIKVTIIRHLLALATIQVSAEYFAGEIGAFLEKYKLEIFFCTMYGLVAGVDLKEIINKLFVSLHYSNRGVNAANFKLRADFYKYGEFYFENTDFYKC